MSDGPSWWHEHTRPRKVDGGIKARTKRGTIGQQWWSRRFIDVLESFGMHGRLARGRSYARAGQILDFELASGYVTARVQGSRAVPYLVRIKVLPLTTKQWHTVEEALAGQALFRAKLLAGEMPPEIEQVFADCGTPLFPRSLRDLEMSCSCPDWEVPCKHLAATCYVLAEKFDDDPFLVLAWRGKGRAELLDRLRGAHRQGSAAVEPGAAVARIEVADPPLADCLDAFWSPGISVARLRAVPVTPATTPDLLLRSSEPPPLHVRRRDLVSLLTPAYLRMADGETG